MTEALGSADERTTRYFYNDAGQLYSQKNPNGVELFHFYDSRGRLADLISADNSIRYQYTYDANNNVLSVQDIVTGQTTTREFDENNRVKKETQATGFVLEYAYDRAGRETRILLPGSNAVDYAYNAAFLTAVRRMTNVANLGASGSLAYQHSYTSNDLAGNILGVTLASGQSQTFQTDRLNRRTLISGPAWTQTVSATQRYDRWETCTNFTINDPGATAELRSHPTTASINWPPKRAFPIAKPFLARLHRQPAFAQQRRDGLQLQQPQRTAFAERFDERA